MKNADRSDVTEQFETVCVHGDADAHNLQADITPAISLTTIYDRTLTAKLGHALQGRPGSSSSLTLPRPYNYSRESTPIRDRVEQLLATIEGHGLPEPPHAILFASGMAAIRTLFTLWKPARVAFEQIYTGTLMLIHELQLEAVPLDQLERLQPGDFIWLETPSNPDGNLQDIQRISQLGHERGAIVIVDGTLGPPPLQFALHHGCDVLVQSLTKYYGGHSDVLAGALIVKCPLLADKLRRVRIMDGSVPGSLETWLLLRSIRTMPLRVLRQSANATEFANWLVANQQRFGISRVAHLNPRTLASAAPALVHTYNKQMVGGATSLFSIFFAEPSHAARLPLFTHIFRNAPSLGSVESLVDYRYPYDPENIPPNGLRFSIGVENVEDLKKDFERAFHKMTQPSVL